MLVSVESALVDVIVPAANEPVPSRWTTLFGTFRDVPATKVFEPRGPTTSPAKVQLHNKAVSRQAASRGPRHDVLVPKRVKS